MLLGAAPRVWRWFPVLAPLAWLAVWSRLPLTGVEALDHRSLVLVITAGWAVTAVTVAVTSRHRKLTQNLRAMSPGPFAAAWAALMVVGALAWAHHASWSFVPLLLLVFHYGLAGERPRIRIAAILLAVLCPLLAAEAALYAVRHVPSIPGSGHLIQVAFNLYQLDRGIIQYDPACAEHDDILGYKLRPGECEFGSTEYDNKYRINHLGVRDDEESLVHPDVVVLGDSFTMGLGVDQEQTYASVIEGKTGLRVLNTGVASYATNRELAMLSRVDRSHLRYLLVQYCNNDAPENEAFHESRGHIHPLTQRDFDHYSQLYAELRIYYPLRYVAFMVNDTLYQTFQSKGIKAAPRVLPETPAEEMDILLEEFQDVAADLSGVDIIIYELSEKEGMRYWFDTELRAALERSAGRHYMDRIHVVNVTKDLRAEDFFVLDGHINASGHRKVAEKLVAEISKLNRERR